MILKVENLVKRYGDLVALDHFNLEVQEGEILGLLGPNGSGKTTVINCILSILKYDKGNIKIFGKPMNADAYDIKKDIGLVMQDVAVFEELTVYENIHYFCGLYIKDKAQLNNLVDEAINFVDLDDFRKFLPKKLSGGLLRRLNIACGIAHKPKLIILDEPTVAVDPQSRNNILQGLKLLNKQGVTIIYTSHYMEEVEMLCSRIAIMDKGKTMAEGTKEELKAMIKLGEKIKIEVFSLPEETLTAIKKKSYVVSAKYENNMLQIKCLQGKHNLTNMLEILNANHCNTGQVTSELPSLNDVFLEITGKELRD